MRVQRIIASVLLSVLFLTPLAPALVTQAEAMPQHCVRQPLSRETSSATPSTDISSSSSSQPSGMHCHEGIQHATAQSSHSSDDSKSKSDHQFGSNGCCTSHDCCNSTVRSQWAKSTQNSVFTIVEPTHILSAQPVPMPQSANFYLARGRAPPAL